MDSNIAFLCQDDLIGMYLYIGFGIKLVGLCVCVLCQEYVYMFE